MQEDLSFLLLSKLFRRKSKLTGFGWVPTKIFEIKSATHLTAFPRVFADTLVIHFRDPN